MDTRIASRGVDTKNNQYKITLDESDPKSTWLVDDFTQANENTRTAPLPIKIELGEIRVLPVPAAESEEMPSARAVPGAPYPGVKLGTSNPHASYLSLGVWGTYYGRNAILTCGHTFFNDSSGEVVYFYDGAVRSVLGQMIAYHSGSFHASGPAPIMESHDGEWAIITSPEAPPFNDVHYNGVGTYAYRYVYGATLGAPIGTIVNGSGFNTPDYTVILTDINISETFRDKPNDPMSTYHTFTGVNRCEKYGSAMPVPGDSGGPLYYYDYFRGGYILLGTLSTGDPSYITYSPFVWAHASGFSMNMR